MKESGLAVNPLWPFLGALPDGIQYCKCHPKTLVEIKGLFSKQNLLPAVPAADKLIKTTKGYQLKVEKTWYSQIQGQMAITGVKRTALVIYTNKGILIVPVEFDPVFWLKILKKLQLFFVEHLAPGYLQAECSKMLRIKNEHSIKPMAYYVICMYTVIAQFNLCKFDLLDDTIDYNLKLIV